MQVSWYTALQGDGRGHNLEGCRGSCHFSRKQAACIALLLVRLAVNLLFSIRAVHLAPRVSWCSCDVW